LADDEMTAPSNFAHPGCYASALNDCSEKLSREHYVSAGVLKVLGDENRITNASWLAPGEQSAAIPSSALGSNILCGHHNSALSWLDTHAKEFFTQLVWGFSDMPPCVPQRSVSFVGEHIELWVLKAACGAVASGNLLEHGRAIKRQPPIEWLNLLFRGGRWEEGAGLHILPTKMTPHRGYAIGPVYLGDTWIGGVIDFAGIELAVLVDGRAEKRVLEQSSNEFSPLVYRPGAISIESRTRAVDITLRWRTWVSSQGVRYQYWDN
jgi:hypothetical protein